MAKAKKLPSGNWRIIANKTVDGKKIRKSFTDENKRTVEAMAAQWVTNDEYSDTSANMTFENACKKYIESKSSVLSPSTIQSYKVILRNNIPDLLTFPINKLTTSKIQTTINALSKDHAPKTVRNVYGLITTVLKFYRPTFNPTVTLPQKEKTEMYIPDDNDIKTILADVKGEDIEIAIMLAAFGPMRRGEICALTSDDIHGNVITINKSLVWEETQNGWRVKQPKNYSSNRDITFPDFVIERLQGINGRIYAHSPTTLSRSFAAVLKRNNLPHFRFHDLRHYSVSIQHALGVPDKYIMARGGWSTNSTMNNVYNHILKKNEDEQTLKIIDHFSSLNQ